MSGDLNPDSTTQTIANTLQWQRLELLRPRLEANCNALAKNNPTLASLLRRHQPSHNTLVIAVNNDELIIAHMQGTTAYIHPCRSSAAASHKLLLQAFPHGQCNEALLIAGVDQGWLWQLAYTMPCANPALPGYRPPLYLLTQQLEELWIALHLHDWQTLLSDQRVRLLVGQDVAHQFPPTLFQDPQIAWPRLALTIEPTLWPQPGGFEAIINKAQADLGSELQQIMAGYATQYDWATPQTLAAKLQAGLNGQKLRILGITSRYTTFLQYSMRDWLSAFTRLGHETQLLIEHHDHEMLTPICFARECARFKPDLILLIDHFRKEFGVLPEAVPCVMWVQDRLPNIFSSTAGAAQQERDFCLGFGRLHLSSRFGYPAQRYLSSTMGVNDERFASAPRSVSDLQRFACDLSFVSHASTPADVLLQNQMEQSQLDPAMRRYMTEVYDRMVAHYESSPSSQPGGGWALSDPAIRLLLDATMEAQGILLPEATLDSLGIFFNQQISNALFRHQTLRWLGELATAHQLDFRIYGRGWEKHPQLAPFARGVAHNDTELNLIYRASKINIQVTPHGAVHQRLLDGLAANAFFLLRWHPGDVVGPHYQQLWAWCQKHQIKDAADLQNRADPQIQKLLQEIDLLEGAPVPPRKMTNYDIMLGHQDSDFMTSAASIWPEYPQIAFRNKTELAAMVTNFLADDSARQTIASSMRTTMIDRSSYLGISRRLLQLMARELAQPTAQPQGTISP